MKTPMKTLNIDPRISISLEDANDHIVYMFRADFRAPLTERLCGALLTVASMVADGTAAQPGSDFDYTVEAFTVIAYLRGTLRFVNPARNDAMTAALSKHTTASDLRRIGVLPFIPLFDRNDCILDEGILSCFGNAITLFEHGDEAGFTAARDAMFADFPIDVYGPDTLRTLRAEMASEIRRIRDDRRFAAAADPDSAVHAMTSAAHAD